MASDAPTTGAPTSAPRNDFENVSPSHSIVDFSRASTDALQRKAGLGLGDEGALFAATHAATIFPLTRAKRARIGRLIETLIALLDHDDGDPDMEDGDLDRCTAGEDGPKVDAGFDRLWRNAA